eukprot:6498700-Karenia_brevis.AAC.1
MWSDVEGQEADCWESKCPGPEIWGLPHQDSPWIVPLGYDIQSGNDKVVNTGPSGHKLQWFRGTLYCTKCGGWTAQSGRPRKLVQECNGKGQRALRILQMVEDSQ